MKFIADFHIHSKYSRATAKNLDLENLYIAAQVKGITVIGTGDYTHPAWYQEICDKLEPAEQGLFTLKPEIARHCDNQVPGPCRAPVRFMLTTEISNIYKKNNKTRKNHNLVFLPDLESAQKFNQQLDQIGNIASDGRPILGLDARNLLEIVLETAGQGYLIPAHVWTPWFSLLGSKSGFDSVEECFEDLSKHIFALETGLSSDPPMNWRVSALDRYTLVSNSDAHSPFKLGREANLFDTDLSFDAIRLALENNDEQHFLGTFEFYPEEGKYHLDGHRKCDFRSLPKETRALANQCPVCGKPLTLGVLYRVENLADRPAGQQPAGAKPYYNLIPLDDILAEVFQCGSKTKKVTHTYHHLVHHLGSEFDILHRLDQQTIDDASVPLLAEAIERMRKQEVLFAPGYDGEFGKVQIFDAEERISLQGQQSLFNISTKVPRKKKAAAPVVSAAMAIAEPKPIASVEPGPAPWQLNPEQQAVVDHHQGPLMIVAGPGTGKTRTITQRMADLIARRKVNPSHILAVTFTNKAAQEMCTRLEEELGKNNSLPLAVTFHGFCWRLLQEASSNQTLFIADDLQRQSILTDAISQVNALRTVDIKPKELLEIIVRAKQQLIAPDEDLSSVVSAEQQEIVAAVYAAYQELMHLQHLLDFEDLILRVVRRLERDEQWQQQIQSRFTHIFVDEFQDINHGQYQLIRALAPAHFDLCVIGDPDQSIYGFRGSDIVYFQRFKQDYPTVRTIRLNRNYRSTEAILQSAFQVIKDHQINIHKERQVRTYSQIDGCKTISIMQSPTARAEAVLIGRTIEQMVGGTGFHAIDFDKVDGFQGTDTYGFADFAVLFRTRDQGRLIADVLTQAGIPCQQTNSSSWHQAHHIRKLLAALRVVTGQGTYTDMQPLIDITTPGISRQTLDAFKQWAYERQWPLHFAIQKALRLPINGMTIARQQRLTALIRLLNDLGQAIAQQTVADALGILADRITLSFENTDENVQQIQALAVTFDKDVQAFLTALALHQDTDLYRPEVEKVALMTMHAAKGLEFPAVFVAGCEDGLLPFYRPDQQVADLQEERRLFYVAMTRAGQRLFLCWARKRMRYGKIETRQVSPFLTDIEQRLKENIAAEYKDKKPAQEQLPLF